MTRATSLRLILSGLTPAALEEWLAEIRRVAALQGRAALEAADALVWNAAQAIGQAEAVGLPADGQDWETDLMQRQLDRVADTCARLHAAPPASLQLHNASTLRAEADRLGQLIEPGIRQTFAAKIMAIRSQAMATAAAVERTCHAQVILHALTQPIDNAAGVTRIIGVVDRAVESLTLASALTDELGQAATHAKGRAARYRSERRVGEAEVAEAGGNLRKAARLRAEAQVMLAQDLARACPGDSAPPGAGAPPSAAAPA